MFLQSLMIGQFLPGARAQLRLGERRFVSILLIIVP